MPISYDDDVHPYADLVAGRVDAVLLDNIIADRSLRRMPGFVVQPDPVAIGHYVAVLRPGEERRARFGRTRSFARAMRDGSLEKVFRAWNVWDDDQAKYFAARPRRRRPRGRDEETGSRSDRVDRDVRAGVVARRGNHACCCRVSR